MKKASIALFFLVVVMVVCASLPAAWGYFNTYTRTQGGMPIGFRSETEFEEDVSEMTKHLTVKNKEGSPDIFVRARGFSDSAHPLTYSAPDGGWVDGGDGFWYYQSVLAAGESTTKLDVKISLPEGVEFKDGDEFNVVVVYESTLALYNEDGPYADWSVILDSHEEEAGL